MRILKRTVLALLGVVAVFLVIGFVSLYSRMEQPPDALYPSASVLLDARYAAAGESALQELAQARDRRHFPSISLAVGVNGILVWAGTVGYEDVARGIPATPETRYHVASIAKSWTSYALGKMVQEDLIALDTPFRTLASDFGDARHSFTVGQLQSHRAGVRHHASLSEAFNRRNYDDVRTAAALVEGDPLLFEPGARVSYSTPAYSLLALAMERAASRDYLDLMDELVFGPFAMTDTFADSASRPASGVAAPYVVHDDLLIRGPTVNYSDRWAGGGFFSTPTDVVRYGNAVLSGSGMTPEWWALAVNGQRTDDSGADGAVRYPLLFGEGESDWGRRLSVGGSGWGGRAALNIYPELGVAVAIATNSRPSDNAGPDVDLDAIAHLFASSD